MLPIFIFWDNKHMSILASFIIAVWPMLFKLPYRVQQYQFHYQSIHFSKYSRTPVVLYQYFWIFRPGEPLRTATITSMDTRPYLLIYPFSIISSSPSASFSASYFFQPVGHLLVQQFWSSGASFLLCGCGCEDLCKPKVSSIRTNSAGAFRCMYSNFMQVRPLT